jgi:CubicO group peptidase (beta-lactamase class C family)
VIFGLATAYARLLVHPKRRSRPMHLHSLIFAASMILLVACTGGGGDVATEPGREPEATASASDSWPQASPDAHGVDGALLAELDAEIRNGDHGLIDAMLVFRHGKQLADYRYEQDYVAKSASFDLTPHQYNYYHPDWHPFFKGSEVHTLQSVTKSVTSLLIGIAIGEGKIEGTSAPAMQFFSDYEIEDPDGRKAEMTLEDLLTMRAGFEWDESTVTYTDPRNDCAVMEGSFDWVSFVLSKPLAADPGTTFVYNSGVSQLLSAIIRETTGQTIDKYAEQHLFGPLGIDDYHWKITPTGLPDTEGGLYLKPEDLAKLGLLVLQDGMWEGQRIVPEGWIEQSVRPWVEDVNPGNEEDDDPGYGFQWWLQEHEDGSYPKVITGRGYGGQFLIIVPELDLITVFTGWNVFEEGPKALGLFYEQVLPAVSK